MRLELDHFAIGVRSIEVAGPHVEGWFGAEQGDGGPSPGFGCRLLHCTAAPPPGSSLNGNIVTSALRLLCPSGWVRICPPASGL